VASIIEKCHLATEITRTEQGKHVFLTLTVDTTNFSDSVPKHNQALGLILVQL
jgi:hypothetical protein